MAGSEARGSGREGGWSRFSVRRMGVKLFV